MLTKVDWNKCQTRSFLFICCHICRFLNVLNYNNFLSVYAEMCHKLDFIFSVFFFSFSMMSLQTRCQFLNRSSYLSGSVCCGRYDTYFPQGINHVLASSGILKSDRVSPKVHYSVCLMNVHHTEYLRHCSSDFHWTLMMRVITLISTFLTVF